MLINNDYFSCYNCAECSKSLEPGSGFDAPNREVFCKQCYSKLFGVHGSFGPGGENVKNKYHYTQFF